LNENLDVLHAIRSCPLWAIAFLDRQRLDTPRSPPVLLLQSLRVTESGNE
jgi:hypothetical protein